MLSYTQALETILSLPFATRHCSVPLLEAGGRILAADILAPFPQPRFDNSAMDGYACRAADATVVPVTLRVVGESRAGQRHSGSVPHGCAIRISTGAVVPEGLDGIVPVEDTDQQGDAVLIRRPATAGNYIRRRGADVAEGAVLLAAGTRLGPAQVAFLASFNIRHVIVHERPRVGILTSGEEVKELGAELGPDDIVGSSLYYLHDELLRCGCEPRLFGIARDDAEDYARHFQEMLDWSDLLITTAGVSVGQHDVVGDVIQRFGGTVHFWRVAVRPGKPMLVASYGEKHHLGFPGNPVSTCCNTEIFLKPLLRQAFGMASAVAPTRRVRLTASCPRDHQRLFFVYSNLSTGVDGLDVVEPIRNQNSGNLSLCARANALIIVPPGGEPIPVGEMVEVLEIREGL